MIFNTDKQTLDDLNIMGKPGSDSIYSLYNNTNTRGGADILEQLFLHPLADMEAINNRSQTIEYFSAAKLTFPFKTEQLDSAEIYLAMTDQRTRLSHAYSLSDKFNKLIATEEDYKLIYNGIISIINILHDLDNFLSAIKLIAAETPYRTNLEAMQSTLSEPDFSLLLLHKYINRLSSAKTVDFDHLIRLRLREKIKQLLADIYHLDVYMSIASVAAKRNYVFPEALGQEQHIIRLTDVYHPLIKNAVTNNIYITSESNMLFLTGANMAGKSTLMKSLGIALYLAHIGFPVPAAKMKFSVHDGIYTTINLPDDLGAGNSHFYAEVLRVKKIARELGEAKNLFIIFDELFRGTNVKDAYEGTIAVTQAFVEKRNCMFVVSTHITEAGEVLKQRCDNINFVYLPTRMDKNTPVYTYKLEPGITADRHGMIIINNERILEIIRSRKQEKVLLS